MKPLLLLLASWLLAAPAAATTWVPQSSPTTAALHAVAASDSDTWVAVGDAGTIVRSTDGGVHWSSVTNPAADVLETVALRGRVGVAAGIGGRVYRSTDFGASWAEVARPTTKILFSSAIGDSFAVLGGEEGILFASTDSGQAWTPHFAGTASAFFGLGVSGDAAIAAGGAGAIAMSTFRGSAWGLTVIGTALTFFYGVSMATPAIGWAVGTTPTASSLVARTDDGGFVWSGQTAPVSSSLFAVSFLSPSVGTAVGANGVIVHTVDGGATWLAEASGVTQSLNGVALATNGRAVAVGAGGTILRAEHVTAVDPPPIAARSGLALTVLANPTRPGAPVRFALHAPAGAAARVRVFTARGRALATLDAGRAGGDRLLTWSLHDDQGGSAPAGVYFVEARTAEARAVRKFVVLE